VRRRAVSQALQQALQQALTAIADAVVAAFPHFAVPHAAPDPRQEALVTHRVPMRQAAIDSCDSGRAAPDSVATEQQAMANFDETTGSWCRLGHEVLRLLAITRERYVPVSVVLSRHDGMSDGWPRAALDLPVQVVVLATCHPPRPACPSLGPAPHACALHQGANRRDFTR
jgi:hypothetical protein